MRYINVAGTCNNSNRRLHALLFQCVIVARVEQAAHAERQECAALGALPLAFDVARMYTTPGHRNECRSGKLPCVMGGLRNIRWVEEGHIGWLRGGGGGDDAHLAMTRMSSVSPTITTSRCSS